MKLSVSVALVATVGMACGFLSFAAVRAGAVAYLSNEPSACAGCHLMRPRHDSWSRSGHKMVASCNDCHAAHSGATRFVSQGMSGLRHATVDTLDEDSAASLANRTTKETVEAACRRCHHRVVGAMLARAGDKASCVSCHESVGHAKGVSLAGDGT